MTISFQSALLRGRILVISSILRHTSLGALKPHRMASVVTRRSMRLQQTTPVSASVAETEHASSSSTSMKRKSVTVPINAIKKRQKDSDIPISTIKSEITDASEVPTTLPTSPVIVKREDDLASSAVDGSKTPARTPRKRVAAAQRTNAPLQTPGGTRLVRLPTAASPATNQDSGTSPSLTLPSGASTALTTENLLDTAKAHLLSVDPTLKTAVDQFHCRMFDPDGLKEPCEPFAALASGIMGQQVSGAAAASIKNKFVGLFPELDNIVDTGVSPIGGDKTRKFPTPEMVVSRDLPTLRTAGLSQRKAEYIHGLAEKFVSGELSAQMLIDASDEEVLEKLIAVRGLGRWSVEMFACFGLKRTDIFSTGDLGVQRGMAAHKGRDVAKLKNKGGKWKYMSEAEMLATAAPFSPFRSLFMWYMWRIEDVKTDVLET